MENTFKLINNRLKNLEGRIQQYEYFIKRNINVVIYYHSLIKLKKEQSELTKELIELVQYCNAKK